MGSLKFSDIVDVYNDEWNEWVEGVVIKREFDKFYIDCIDNRYLRTTNNENQNKNNLNIIEIKTVDVIIWIVYKKIFTKHTNSLIHDI